MAGPVAWLPRGDLAPRAPAAPTGALPPCPLSSEVARMARDMALEIRTLGNAIAETRDRLDWASAAAALLQAAAARGWRDCTSVQLARLACPAHDPRRQLCLASARFTANLVWLGAAGFAVHSVVFAGLLGFFPASPTGTGAPAIAYGSVQLDLPLRRGALADLVWGRLDQPAAPADLRTSVVAAFMACHEAFGLKFLLNPREL